MNRSKPMEKDEILDVDFGVEEDDNEDPFLDERPR
jgi:hypothetical protein